MKTFHEYHEAVYNAGYPSAGQNIVYPALGLAGEAGEFAEKIKKLWRNYQIERWPCGRSIFYTAVEFEKIQELRDGALKELGDCLWYLDAAALELGSSLEEVAQVNAEKILDRRARDVIKSEGDNR